MNSFPHLAVQHPWVTLGQGSELRKRMTFLTPFHLRDPVMMVSRNMKCAFIHTFKHILSTYCKFSGVLGKMKVTLQYVVRYILMQCAVRERYNLDKSVNF